MTTRRRFLLLLPAYAASAQKLSSPFQKKKPAPPTPVRVYIGSRHNQGRQQGHLSVALRQRYRPTRHSRSRRRDRAAFVPRGYACRATATVRSMPSTQSTNLRQPSRPSTSTSRPGSDQKGKVSSGGAGPAISPSTPPVTPPLSPTTSAPPSPPTASSPTAPSPSRSTRIDYRDPRIRPPRPEHRPSGSARIPTPSTSRPTIVSSSSTISATIAHRLQHRSCDGEAHARHAAAYQHVRPVPARATSPSTPMAAGSTSSTSSTPPSIISSGRQRAAAPRTPRACSSIPAPRSRPSLPAFPPQRTPPPKS